MPSKIQYERRDVVSNLAGEVIKENRKLHGLLYVDLPSLSCNPLKAYSISITTRGRGL